MKFMKQLAIIMVISFIAEIMEVLIPLPIAASVYGLVLMLIGLVTKIIPLEKVEGAADFLIEIMPILFVPAAVGLLDSWGQLRPILIPAIVITVIITVLVMAVTGQVTQVMIRHGKVGSRHE